MIDVHKLINHLKSNTHCATTQIKFAVMLPDEKNRAIELELDHSVHASDSDITTVYLKVAP